MSRWKSAAARSERVVIIGGGFSGSIQAINLLRHGGPSVVLIERRPEAGRGIAFSALLDEHLLNVRASNMSAFPDDPDDFVRWLDRRGLGKAADFVSRRVYGDYLSELLDQSARKVPGRLNLRQGEAVDVTTAGDGFRILLASGEQLEADQVILAIGNLPPHQINVLAQADLDTDLYASNPWSPDIMDGVEDEDDLLVIGTGLTMVDVALFCFARDFRGRIFALSRRGLVPRSHEAGAPPHKLGERPGTLNSKLVRKIRVRSEQVGWRNAVDELRPFTQSIWRASTVEEQQRFLRHLRPWWDVHRHRIAPQVAQRLDALRARGSLQMLAGTIQSAEANRGSVQVSWMPRSGGARSTLHVRRIINCTGPQGDLLRTKEVLLRNLIERGMMRPDTNRLGIDVNQQGEVIGGDGRPQPGLFAIGPMTRGAFWEIVAVPDIRVQAWNLARRLSNVHWVEGHGL